MRYTKILGLLAVAAAAMMAFAASASATTVSSTTGGEPETLKIHAVHEDAHFTFHNSIANIQCNSTFEATVEKHGAGITTSGNISHRTITSCTNGWTALVDAAGSLEIHHTSGHNGTVISSGVTVRAIRHTIFGTVECRYATNNTHLGTITGGNPATIHSEATIPFHSGGGLCGEGTAGWTGNYVTTHPLYVAA